jgi:hypothetical protein
MHTDTQLPAVHTVPALHRWPHEPQFWASVLGSTQAPLQDVVPAAHVDTH